MMREENKGFVEGAEAMYDRLKAWRETHPQATFDEIAQAIRQERKKLTGRLAAELAVQGKREEQWQEVRCPKCGGLAENKGDRGKRVVHEEGESWLERPYYHCPECGNGFFPLG